MLNQEQLKTLEDKLYIIYSEVIKKLDKVSLDKLESSIISNNYESTIKDLSLQYVHKNGLDFLRGMDEEYILNYSFSEKEIESRKTSNYGLIDCAIAEKYDLVKKLVIAGVDVTVNNSEVLRIAVNQKDIDLLKEMIKRGADIHYDNDDALYCAILFHNEEAINLFVENGCVIRENMISELTDYINFLDDIIAEKILYSPGTDIPFDPHKEIKEKIEPFLLTLLKNGLNPQCLKDNLEYNHDEFIDKAILHMNLDKTLHNKEQTRKNKI